jgi:hypothetical protein
MLAKGTTYERHFLFVNLVVQCMQNSSLLLKSWEPKLYITGIA